jgi:DNA-directed RNA polymerase delta subunit
MRTIPLVLATLLTSGVAANAQDVRGVIDNLNRAVNPQQQQTEPQSRDRDRQQSHSGDTDRMFTSEGVRRMEYEKLSDSDRRRYDNATPGERKRWDDEFSDNARDRWQRMSDSERRRYEEDVQRADRRLSGSSSDRPASDRRQ